MTILPVVYDLAAAPITYDVMNALVVARLAAMRDGYEGFRVTFVADRFRDATPKDKALTVEEKLWRVEHIHLALALRTKGCVGAQVSFDRRHLVFPAQPFSAPFMARQLFACAPTQDELTAFAPSKSARRRIGEWLGDIRNPVTITLRSSPVEPHRNTDASQWLKAAEQIRDRGYDPIIVPDHDEATIGAMDYGTWPVCALAAIDLDLRLALYERSINLSHNGGPSFLAYFMGAPLVSFLPVDNLPTVSPDIGHMASMLGVAPNGDWPHATPGRVLIWEPATVENIVAAFDSVTANKVAA